MVSTKKKKTKYYFQHPLANSRNLCSPQPNIQLRTNCILVTFNFCPNFDKRCQWKFINHFFKMHSVFLTAMSYTFLFLYQPFSKFIILPKFSPNWLTKHLKIFYLIYYQRKHTVRKKLIRIIRINHSRWILSSLHKDTHERQHQPYIDDQTVNNPSGPTMSSEVTAQR